MNIKRFLLTMAIVVIVMSVQFFSAAAQNQPAEDGVLKTELSPDAINPQPIAPQANYIFTKTPKFYFTRNMEADKYEIKVMKFTGSEFYTFRGKGECTDYYCWLQPTTKLVTTRYEEDTGYYYWYVRAHIGDHWEDFTSASDPFIVYAKGFTSTFDLNTSKWQPVFGEWIRTSRGYYKTMGEKDLITSTMQQEFFMDHIVFEVKMKRKVDGTASNQLLLHTVPDPVSADGTWNSGFSFGYTNYGIYRIGRIDAGVTTNLLEGFTEVIEPWKWNTLTIWHDAPNLIIWINGVYIASVKDSSYNWGWVGIAMEKHTEEDSPLLVDYAKVYYSGITPYAIPEGIEDD